MVSSRLHKCFTVVLLLITFSSVAQDPEFSQYYAAPLYLNPAFAGTSVDHRFIVNYRNQWPNVNHAFETYAASYDYNLDQLNSGLGFLIVHDKAGSAHLKSTQFNFQYAYKVKLSENWIMSTGFTRRTPITLWIGWPTVASVLRKK